jgi:hypothetical protein
MPEQWGVAHALIATDGIERRRQRQEVAQREGLRHWVGLMRLNQAITTSVAVQHLDCFERCRLTAFDA